MNLLLAFAPFVVFVIVEHLLGTGDGLVAGAITSAILLARDIALQGRRVKLLEIGTLLLFSGLAIFAFGTDAHWSIAAVRLRVDAGLMAIVLVSIALRQPFSLQYARETVDRKRWDNPEFLHMNDVISAAWGLAFGVLVLADILMARAQSATHAIGIVATVLALVGAVKFTDWYPKRHRVAGETQA